MAAPQPITLACQDTSLKDILLEVYGARLKQTTGRSLTIDRQDYDYDTVADMVDEGATRWDVCETDATECALLGRAGLLTAIDWTAIDRHAAPPGFSVPWWGVPCYLYSYVIAYDHAAFAGAVPQGWSDLWDVVGFPGRRVIPRSVSGVCEAAAMAIGVAPSKVYPLDVDKALAWLHTLRDAMLFTTNEQQAADLLSHGAASMGMVRSTTAHRLRAASDGRIDFIWSQAILAPSLMMVPKEAPSGPDAMHFIAATQDSAAQVELLRRSGCGPVNPAARDALTGDLTHLDPGSAEHRAIGVGMDAPWYLANMRWLQPRWTRFVEG